MAPMFARWNALGRSSKLLAGGLLLALLAAGALVMLLGRDDRVALYGKPLLPEQVAEVDARLASWNVPHRTSVDNVLVEPGARSGLLLKLSLEGVPRAHVVDSGEALAKVGTLTPQSVLEAQARQGLEGDLVTALRGIAGIQDAYVLVAPAKAAFYADEAPRPASASVKLTLQPGAPPLAPRTVDGIRSFVANGVPGLDPARVAVMDDRGTALGGEAVADGDGAKLQHDVQHALDAAFGAGTTQVLVHAETDARTSSQREIKRAPVLGKPIASSTVDEHYSGASKSYTKLRSSEDRGSVAVETDSKTPAGTLARLSVAVMVDTPLHGQLPQIRDIVAAAVGLNPRRGDALTIQPVAFARNAPLAAARQANGPDPIALARSPLTYAALGLGLLGLVLLAWGPLTGFARGSGQRALPTAEIAGALPPPEPVAAFDVEKLRARLAGEPPWTAAAVIARLPAAQAVALLDLYDLPERAEIVKRLGRPIPLLASDAGVELAS